MSAGFLLPTEETALIWIGPKKNSLIKHLLRDVDWGNLDFLLVDTQPSMSNEHLSLVQYLEAAAGLNSFIIVKVGLRVVGVLENMSKFACPKCNNVSMILLTRMA